MFVLALLALAAAAASDVLEDASEWRIRIDDDEFDLVDYRVIGAIDVDLQAREVTGFTFVSGAEPPRERNVLRLQVEERFSGASVRAFFDAMDLEGIRQSWKDGEYLEAAHGGIGFEFERAMSDFTLVKIMTAREFIDSENEYNSTSDTIERMLREGAEFFDDPSYEVRATDEQKRRAIVDALEKMIRRVESDVEAISRVPVDVVEVRNLLGLSPEGLRITLCEGTDLEELTCRYPGLELVDHDAWGREVYQFFLP